MNNKDKIDNLKLSIEELRRMYDWISNNYSNLRSKILVFIGADFAFLSYFFGTNGFFYPKETYGIIFFFIGLILCLLALSLMLIAIHPVRWTLPPDFKEYKELKFNTHIAFLTDVNENYIDCNKQNLTSCENKHNLLNRSFYFLIIGVTLLLIIKIFG